MKKHDGIGSHNDQKTNRISGLHGVTNFVPMKFPSTHEKS